MDSNLMELLLKKVNELEKKLELYYELLRIENEVSFILNGTYCFETEIDAVVNGEY